MADGNKGPNVQFATALVYWGAAFLVLILGFRAILETLELSSLKMPITYLAVVSLIAEFGLLLFYGNTIRTAKPAETPGGGLPPQLAADVSALVALMRETSETMVAIGARLAHAAETAEQSAGALTGIAERSQAASAQAAEALDRRAVEMQSLTTQALAAFRQSTDTYEQTARSMTQSGERSDRMLQEHQAYMRQALDAYLRSIEAHQELAASLKAQVTALETTATTLSSLSEQEYRRRVLADIMLGLDRTVENLRQGNPGSTVK